MKKTKNTFTDILNSKDLLILDGAWGTELFKKENEKGGGHCLESWNLDYPERVREVANSYVEAGSNIILTNTFGGSPLTLEKQNLKEKCFEINKMGAQLSKDAITGKAGCWVFGSIGPSGEFMEPLGTYTQQQMIDNFTEQVDGLLEGGVDGFVIETASDLTEAECAFKAVRNRSSLPVGISFAYQNQGGKLATMMGVTPAAAAKFATDLGVDFIGANCGLSIDTLLDVVKIYNKSTRLPIWFKPNMGAPKLEGTKVVYKENENALALQVELVKEWGVKFFGGCCGSTPNHIKQLCGSSPRN